MSLQYRFTTTLSYYSLTMLPALGGTIAPPSGLYLAGSTQYVTALPSRDFQFVSWQGSIESAQNPLMLVMTQNHTLSATFKVISYTDGFESGLLSTNLVWSSGDSVPWQVQSNVVSSGRFAARSGPIGDNQRSSLILDVSLTKGTASFDVKVGSELGWDMLEFYLNGSLERRWTGQVNWQTYQFSVPGGYTRLEWRYSKDANFSAGLDAAFLDKLYLPLPDSSLAPQLSITRLVDGSCQLQLQGTDGRYYAIEACGDMVNWVPVRTNGPPGGSFVWVDVPVKNRPAWFYRAVLK
jgi:hypothetical protein